MREKITILFLLISATTFSQQNNISQFLNDGGRTEASDIVMTDFGEFIQANIPIIWEHRFGDHFAINGGIGLLTQPYFKPMFTPLTVENPIYSDLNGGFSFSSEAKYYYEGFESKHFGFKYRYRKYGSQASSQEYGFMFGRQWLFGRHFSLDLSTGICLNFEQSLDGKSYIYIKDILLTSGADMNMRLVIPISIRAGYVL